MFRHIYLLIVDLVVCSMFSSPCAVRCAFLLLVSSLDILLVLFEKTLRSWLLDISIFVTTLADSLVFLLEVVCRPTLRIQASTL
jgi:hypothetical protein